MPISGSASYSGMAQMTVRESDTVIGELVTDIALDVTFAPNREGSIGGTASNFRGTIDGADMTFAGTLSTEGARAPSTLDITETTTSVPGVGDVTVRPGAFGVNMEGDLTAEGETASVMLTLGGTFAGEAAAAAFGTAGLTSDSNLANPNPVTGAGFFYAERN
jgi:hypothetical protein